MARMAQVLDGILHRELAGLLGRLSVLQVVPVVRVLRFHGGCAAMGMGPRGLPSYGEGGPTNSDLIRVERGKAWGLGTAEMTL